MTPSPTMVDVGATASQAAREGWHGVKDIVEALFKYVVPVLAAVAGLILGVALGLSSFYSSALYSTPLLTWAHAHGAMGVAVYNGVCVALAALTWGVIGSPLLYAGHRMDHVVGYLIEAVGVLFLGMAAVEGIMFLFTQNVIVGSLKSAGDQFGSYWISVGKAA